MTQSRSTITRDDQEFVETWENIAEYQNVVIRVDRKGDEVQEVIIGRRTFMITTAERLITQDRILDEKNDPFLNGAFRPITVPDDLTIDTNPNALADEQIMEILNGSQVAWDEWLKVIDSTATVRRMITLAPQAAGLTLARFQQLEARLNELHPRQQLTHKDAELNRFLNRTPRK